MNAITRTAAALTLTITTVTAAASWDEVKEAANGDYYTAVDSSNVEANELAVYFSAERQCSPRIILFDYQSLESEDVSEWDQVTGERFDSSIDLTVASVARWEVHAKLFRSLIPGSIFVVTTLRIKRWSGILMAT